MNNTILIKTAFNRRYEIFIGFIIFISLFLFQTPIKAFCLPAQLLMLSDFNEAVTEEEVTMAQDTVAIEEVTIVQDTVAMEEEYMQFILLNSSSSGIGGAAAKWVLETLGGMFNQLLLSMADVLQDMIDSIFNLGEPITVYQVIFEKIDKLSINFWGGSTTSNQDVEEGDNQDSEENPTDSSEEEGAPIISTAPAPILKKIVSHWYGVFKGVAIAIFLTVLLYIGVRILLASTGSSKESYKSQLTAWAVGVLLLTFFPVVMQYIININSALLGTLDSNVVNLDSDGDGVADDVMTSVREMAESDNNLALTIVYLIMLGQLIILIGVYYKRVFMVAFLITIFPIVITLYIWDKASKGSSNTFTSWLKEFMLVVLTQSFHAVIYVVLIEGAFAAFRDSDNWLIYIFCVAFLFKAEGIIRSIFDMKSSANTMGELATTGVAVWAVAKNAKNILKGKSNNNNKDKEDLEVAEEEVDEYRKKTSINNTIRNIASNYGIDAESGESGEVGNNFTNENSFSNKQEQLEAAQAFMRQEALKDKTKKGMFTKALGFTGDALARASGITLGLTSGIASGDLKAGVANAVVFNEVAGAVAGGLKTITGYVHGAYRGERLQRKVLDGEFDEQLKEIGVDMNDGFDPDPIINSEKARLFREALAEQISGTRSGGEENGELRFVRSVDRGTKRDKS